MVTNKKLGTAELLFRCAQALDLQPDWLRPNGLFTVVINGQEQYINFARSPLNSHVSSSLARDKYATRLILERNNLPNIPYLRPHTDQEAALFLRQYGKIIAKPVSGSGARDIHLVTDVTQLEGLKIRDYILEQYIAGREMRYLVLNDQVIAVHRSDYGTSVDEHRPLQRISYPLDQWDETLIRLSTKIAATLGLKFAAVDFLIDATGRQYVLEINSTPGLKWFHAPTAGPAIDVARLFFEAILDDYGATITDLSHQESLGVRTLLAYTLREESKTERETVVMKHPVGQTKSGTPVYVDLIHSKAAAHISKQPHLLTLVKEVLAQTAAQGADISIEHDMGHVIGHDFVISTSEKDTIFYAQLVKDSVFTRFVKNGEPLSTQYLSILLHRDEDGEYELRDTWIGRVTPPRPGSADETSESKTYWETHAVVLANQAVQSRTITKVSPY